MGVSFAKKFYFLLKVAWLCSAVAAALGVAWYGIVEDELKRELAVVFYVFLLLLTFPSGGAVQLLAVAVLSSLEFIGLGSLLKGEKSLIGQFLFLQIFVCAGYFQWFVAIPWLWRKWKAHRSRRDGE